MNFSQPGHSAKPIVSRNPRTGCCR